MRSAAEERAERQFGVDIAEHEMTVIKDEGLYRHLRCQKPGTYIYGFDLVTWPGYLAIVGDCGDFMFSRIEDMFQFFAGERQAPGINPDYWGEKLRGPGTGMHRRYSEEAFKARVLEWYNEQAEDMTPGDRPEFRLAVDESLLDAEHYDSHSAMQLLEDFEHKGVTVGDYWEWGDSIRDYDHRFLWCCHAIRWGIERYYKSKAKVAS